MKRILSFLTLLVPLVHAKQPKEIIALKNYIHDARATQFRRSCRKLSITPEQTTMLMTLAHKAKEQRLIELEQMGIHTISKKKIASGCGLATLGTGAIALAIVTSIFTGVLSYENYTNPESPRLRNVINNIVVILDGVKVASPLPKEAHPLYHPIYSPMGIDHIFRTPQQKTLASITTLTTTTAFLGASVGCLFKEAYGRIKLGCNYKTHLQRQVQNLDRIITILQTYATPLDTKEQI